MLLFIVYFLEIKQNIEYWWCVLASKDTLVYVELESSTFSSSSFGECATILQLALFSVSYQHWYKSAFDNRGDTKDMSVYKLNKFSLLEFSIVNCIDAFLYLTILCAYQLKYIVEKLNIFGIEDLLLL